jgi:O-antigen/teichoic acid export membrane protein
MKKNNFIQGAFIASLSIIICKIIGVLYVIPFYRIIGTKGGALYGYAYTFYGLFSAISTIGIPFAISKIVSEYNTLGYYNKKERAYEIGKRIITTLSIIAFITLFLMAPLFAENIMGDVTGGNTKADITQVIRVSAIGLIFISMLSVTKGYLQGHKYIEVTSTSQVIEQLVRVTVIIVGSYLALDVLHIGLTNAVSIAVFGATVGGIAALLYLLKKIKDSKELRIINHAESKEEKLLTDKKITRQILFYALPFLMISFISSSYELIDMFTVVKTLVGTAGFSVKDAESVMSVMTTWGSKLNSIVGAIGSGISVSLIPHITSSFVKKDMKDVESKINKTIEMTLYTTIPMATGLSLLAVPVWNIFYGPAKYGANVFMYTIFISVTHATFLNMLVILQALNKHKTVFISLTTGFIWNAIMNIPFMEFCYYLGIPAYLGAPIATITGHILSILIAIYSVKKEHNFSYKNSLRSIIQISIANILMATVILLLNNLIPIAQTSIINAMLVIIFYAIIGMIVYFTVTYKMNTMTNIFGTANINKIINKILFFKKEKKYVS